MTINTKKASGNTPVDVNFIVPPRIAYVNDEYVAMPKTLPRITRKVRRPIAKLAQAWLL
jgi:hypothetical protein